jgi:hypothetical protein
MSNYPTSSPLDSKPRVNLMRVGSCTLLITSLEGGIAQCKVPLTCLPPVQDVIGKPTTVKLEHRI